jgi:hypothetical protein
MEEERFLRPSLGRYLVLLFVVGVVLTGFFLAYAAVGAVMGHPPAERGGGWLAAVLGPWVIVGVLLLTDLAIGWRCGWQVRQGWRVGPAGVAIYNLDGREVAFLPWAEIEAIRVHALGMSFLFPRQRRAMVWCLITLPRESAGWLRQAARRWAASPSPP